MRFVALLRGINVGGSKKVEMKKLARSFVSAGYTDVTTYINSGNVVFDTGNTEIWKLRNSIEQLIVKDFGFDVPTLVMSAEALRLVEQAIPPDWTNDDEWKTDVCFLWEEIDDESIMHKLGYDEAIETMKYVPGAVIWNVSRENQMKSKMQKVVGTKLYTQMTVRNVNTVRKLSVMFG
jgi:uncharacterized protein (DUF1697 family)